MLQGAAPPFDPLDHDGRAGVEQNPMGIPRIEEVRVVVGEVERDTHVVDDHVEPRLGVQAGHVGHGGPCQPELLDRRLAEHPVLRSGVPAHHPLTHLVHLDEQALIELAGQQVLPAESGTEGTPEGHLEGTDRQIATVGGTVRAVARNTTTHGARGDACLFDGLAERSQP